MISTSRLTADHKI